MIYYITEKEFVPDSVSHLQIGANETQRGLYQIIYGVLQEHMTYDVIYNLVVGICKEQKSEVVMKYKLETWLTEIKSVVKRIENLNVEGKDVMVLIPFTGYFEDVPFTLDLFKFLKYSIEVILTKGDSQMETTSESSNLHLVKPLDELFEDFRKQFEEHLPEEMKPDIPYYRELLHDEMLRRGMTGFMESELRLNRITQKVGIEKVWKTISPSQYYKHPEYFFEFYDLDSNHKELRKNREKIVEESVPSDDGSEKKVNAKEMSGIIYFMLKDIFKDGFDKGNKNKLVSFINFVLDNPFKSKKDRAKDTPRRYMSDFSKNNFDSKFCETVGDALEDYGFKVPKDINALRPKKQ